MTKEEAKYMSGVLKAYSEGKTIQWAWKGDKVFWYDIDGDNWNFETNIDKMDYRIKPEVKYIHYRNAEEFLKAQKEHGPYIRLSDSVYNIPKSVITMRDKVICEFETPAYKSINSIDLLNYRWQDGTVCGIKTEVSCE